MSPEMSAYPFPLIGENMLVGTQLSPLVPLATWPL